MFILESKKYVSQSEYVKVLLKNAGFELNRKISRIDKADGAIFYQSSSHREILFRRFPHRFMEKEKRMKRLLFKRFT